MPTSRKPEIPQNLTGLLVKRPEPLILRGSNEDQSTRRHHGPAEVLRSGYGHTLCRQLLILPERYFPDQLSAIQIDRIQRSPRWTRSGVALLVQKQLVGDIHCVPDRYQFTIRSEERRVGKAGGAAHGVAQDRGRRATAQ